MSEDKITIYISMISIVVGITALVIGYSQMKIASSKTKLDLYNKRFNIYLATLNYYQATQETHEAIKEKSITFTKAYRESLFLFKVTDGIYETLGEIQKNGAIIYGYELNAHQFAKQKHNENNSGGAFLEASVTARSAFEKNLKTLEIQLVKYIQFKTISGWSLF